MRPDIKERIDMINRGEVPEGYKKVNYGIIPRDWTKSKIGDVASFEGGAQPPRSEFVFECKEGYVRLIQTRDYKTDNYKTYIPVNLARKFCRKDDIMIGRYGPPIFQILRGIDGAYNVALIKVIPKLEKIEKDYLFFCLNLESLFKMIDKLSRRSSGQTGVDIDALNNYGLPLPPVPEQQKIAEILTTCDKVIELKEKLIKQKKEQMKGLMQTLLTGKVRVNEFGKVNQEKLKERIEMINRGEVPEGYQKVKRFIIPKDWEFTKIYKIADQVTESNNENNDHRVFSCTKYNGLVDSLEYFKKQVYSKDLRLYKVVRKNYFVYATNHIEEGSIGLQELCDIGLVSPMYTVFKVRDSVNSKYLYAVLKTENYRRIYVTMMSASIDRRGSLRWNVFSQIKIPFPPLDEQQKIAEILSLLEKEIQLLEQELATLKEQKKGLMQLLLTGKVRVKSVVCF